MLGFLGTGGVKLTQIEADLHYIQKELTNGEAYGINFLYNLNDPIMEEKTIDLILATGVRIIEAAAFLSITPALVLYHAKGLQRDQYRKSHQFKQDHR